jgi:hypothetical protein
MDKLQDVIRRVVEDPTRKIDPRLLSRDLGVGYRSLMYWIGGSADRHFPAELSVPLCKLLDSYEVLDFIERQAGRLAFSIPQPDSKERADAIKVQRLLKEVAEAVGSLCAALEDGIIEGKEAEATVSELDDVIRHCALLRFWVQQQAAPKRVGTRRTTT